MSWLKTTSRLLWLVVLVSILFYPDNVQSRLLSGSSDKTTNIQEPVQDAGYLADIGPVPIRYAKQEVPFNRLDLIPLPEVKKPKPEPTALPTPAEKPPAPLEYTAGKNSSINAAPVNGNVTANELPAINNNNSLSPDDILLFLEKDRNSDKTGTNDKVVLPFRLPFQDSNAALPPPSKAIYERQ